MTTDLSRVSSYSTLVGVVWGVRFAYGLFAGLPLLGGAFVLAFWPADGGLPLLLFLMSLLPVGQLASFPLWWGSQTARWTVSCVVWGASVVVFVMWMVQRHTAGPWAVAKLDKLAAVWILHFVMFGLGVVAHVMEPGVVSAPSDGEPRR